MKTFIARICSISCQPLLVNQTSLKVLTAVFYLSLAPECLHLCSCPPGVCKGIWISRDNQIQSMYSFGFLFLNLFSQIQNFRILSFFIGPFKWNILPVNNELKSSICAHVVFEIGTLYLNDLKVYIQTNFLFKMYRHNHFAQLSKNG